MIDFIVDLIILLKVRHLALKYDTFRFFTHIRVTTFLSTTQVATKGVKRRGQSTHIGRKNISAHVTRMSSAVGGRLHITLIVLERLPERTPANIRIYLIFLETTIIGLHLTADNIGLSSLKFLW